MLKESKVNFEDAKAMIHSLIDFSQIWFHFFDSKSGFHYIDIFPPDPNFLGFS